MTQVEGKRQPFGKQIGIGGNGRLTITSPDGVTSHLKSEVKEIKVPPELLNNMAALIMQAFPNEFEGTEGAFREDEITMNLTRRYAEEQPLEVAERTLPAIMALGISAERLAEEIMSSSGSVRAALNLDSMSQTDLEIHTDRLREVIAEHWPSFSQKR